MSFSICSLVGGSIGFLLVAWPFPSQLRLDPNIILRFMIFWTLVGALTTNVINIGISKILY